MIEPIRRSFVSQRLSLNAVEWPNPGKPVLVLVHGALDHARSWDWTVQALADDWHIVAPDLRGHGDSDWAGDYSMHGFVADLVALIDEIGEAQVTLVGHSLGGNIAIRYSALFPDSVRKLVAIEGLGPSPAMLAEREADGFENRLRKWIADAQRAATSTTWSYPSVEDATERMIAANKHLSTEQAHHLTRHGVRADAGGNVSWKFDPLMRVWTPVDLTPGQIEALWAQIRCPTLLCYGAESWASNPADDGRAAHFGDARVRLFDKAGHWLHLDNFDAFITELRGFL